MVLGPTLFLILIYVNDIDAVIDLLILKFADDTKLYRSVLSLEHAQKLQENLLNVANWSHEWLMLFNVTKCSDAYRM